MTLCLQLEGVLNRTSPFSIWINGENMDVLQQEGQRQSQEFTNLEEKYSEMAHGVNSIFSNSMKVRRIQTLDTEIYIKAQTVELCGELLDDC